MMPTADGLPAPARYRSAAVISLGVVLSALDGSVVSLALPRIAQDLQITPAESVWLVYAFQLAALVMLMPLAALGDRIGSRRVYLAGIAVFTAASAMCLSASSLPMLALGRGLQGVGAAGIMAVNGALLRLTYPKSLFGRGIAINAGIVASATVAGPVVAAAILSIGAWPWLFALNIPMGLLVIVLGWRALPHNMPNRPAVDALRARDVVLNGLMFGLVFLGVHALVSGSTGIPVPVGLAMLGAGIVLGAWHLRRQWGMRTPLFPVDLLRIPVFGLSVCTSVTAFIAQTLAYVALPFLLLDYLGRSPAEAGILMTAWPLAVVAAVPVASRTIGRYPGGLLGGAGMGTMAVGLALLALLPMAPTAIDIAWRLAVCGVGFGLFQSPNNHAILTSAPAHRTGAAGGMLGTARLTGQTIGAVLLVLIFSHADAQHGRESVMALWLACGFAVLGGMLSMWRWRHALVAR